MPCNPTICKYTPVRICDEYGVNARFNLLFKEVCALKSTPYTLPIASASVLGGIKVGSGLSINSTTGVLSTSGSSSNVNFIPITQADFENDGVTYLNSSLDSANSILIFWDNIGRHIYEADGEWAQVSGGIEITIPGFDATSNTYNLVIFTK